MKKYSLRKASNMFLAAALLLSHIMVGVVTAVYWQMKCGIQHMGYSAPAWVAFIYVVPFGAAIIVCVIAALVLRRKDRG